MGVFLYENLDNQITTTKMQDNTFSLRLYRVLQYTNTPFQTSLPLCTVQTLRQLKLSSIFYAGGFRLIQLAMGTLSVQICSGRRAGHVYSVL